MRCTPCSDDARVAIMAAEKAILCVLFEGFSDKMYCTFNFIAHFTLNFFTYIYVYSLVLCYIFCTVHWADLAYISLLIIFCIIEYVTNKNTLNLDLCCCLCRSESSQISSKIYCVLKVNEGLTGLERHEVFFFFFKWISLKRFLLKLKLTHSHVFLNLFFLQRDTKGEILKNIYAAQIILSTFTVLLGAWLLLDTVTPLYWKEQWKHSSKYIFQYTMKAQVIQVWNE